MPDNHTSSLKKVLILGGYGTFGSRIAERLAEEPALHLVIAGRDRFKAELFANRLQARFPGSGENAATFEGLQLDRDADDLGNRLKAIGVDLLIHCAGPFHGQSYGVACACIKAGCAYIDMADSADFICGIETLSEDAKSAAVPVYSGAGTLPALSSAVLAMMAERFVRIERIATHIVPARRIVNAHASRRSGIEVLGETFSQLESGQSHSTFTGNNLRQIRFGHPVGPRWVCDFESADLHLAPACFPALESLQTSTGLQPAPLQFGLAACARIAHRQLPARREALRTSMTRIGHWLADHWPGRSPNGGLLIEVSGQVKGQRQGEEAPGHARWQILGLNGDGPWIPAAPATALAKKLLKGETSQPGARPCWQLLTLEDILAELTPYSVVSAMEVQSTD